MSSSKPHLLPPSSFQAPAARSHAQDPWTVIQQTASEILQLQESVQKLKDDKQRTRATDVEHMHNEMQPQPVMQKAAREPMITTALPFDFSAYDNIIRRQGTTIEQLQDQLKQSELKHEKLFGQLENERLVKESQYIQHVADLNNEIKALTKSHDVELRALLEEKERQQLEWTQMKTDWQTRFRAKEEAVEEMEKRLTEVMTSVDEQKKQVSKEIREKDDKIEELKQQVNQLRTYLNESDSMSKSTDIWKKEIQDLKNRVQSLDSDKNRLTMEKELLTTRLNALNDILSIQEKQVSQGSGDPTAVKRCLLTVWREKVFELMVQLKAAALSSTDEKRNLTNKMNCLEKNCKDLENKCQVLSHVIREKQATVELEGAATKSLRIELEAAYQMLEKEKQVQSQSFTSLSVLKDLALETVNRYATLEVLIKQVDTSFKSFNKRISFASGRVELLQAQFARKEAMLKMELIERTKENEDINTVTSSNQELDECRAELERVTSERNSLAAQTASDAQKLQERIQNATKKATEEANDFRQMLDDLHEKFDRKSEKVEELSCLLEVSHQELRDAQAELQLLKFELEKSQIRSKSEIENREAAIQEEFSRQLNEVKREHTKAVVRVRQLERQMERDKERWTTQIDSVVCQHQQEVAKLKEKLLLMEKDNNILMATLRQEGLLSKARRQRPVPVGLPLRADDHIAESSGDVNCIIPYSADATQNQSVLPPGDGISHCLYPAGETGSVKLGNSEQNSSQLDAGCLHAMAEDVRYLAIQVLKDDKEDLEDAEDPCCGETSFQ